MKTHNLIKTIGKIIVLYSFRKEFYLIEILLFLADFSDQDSDSDWDDQTIQGSDSCGTSTLDDGCSMSDDCSTITCKTNFVEKPITLKLKVSLRFPYERNVIKKI